MKLDFVVASLLAMTMLVECARGLWERVPRALIEGGWEGLLSWNFSV